MKFEPGQQVMWKCTLDEYPDTPVTVIKDHGKSVTAEVNFGLKISKTRLMKRDLKV